MARIERLSDEPDYQLPDVGELGYLVGYLSEVGEAQGSGSGIIATSWRDLKAWSQLTGVVLSPLEFKALRRLSCAYVAEFYKADGIDCQMPHVNELPKSEVVDMKIKSFLAMLRS